MAFRARIKTKKLDGRARAIEAAMRRFKGSKVTAGVHEDAGTYEMEGQKEPVPVSKVAFWLENGTQFMPARPFFAPTLMQREGKIAKLKAEAVASVAMAGASIEHALSHIGFVVQTWFQNAIKSNIGPALTSRYLRSRRKKYPESGSRTLIASGLLLRSIRYKYSVNGGEWVTGATDAPEPLPAEQGKSRQRDPESVAGEQARREAVEQAQSAKETRRRQRENAALDRKGQAKRFGAQRKIPPQVGK